MSIETLTWIIIGIIVAIVTIMITFQTAISITTLKYKDTIRRLKIRLAEKFKRKS